MLALVVFTTGAAPVTSIVCAVLDRVRVMFAVVVWPTETVTGICARGETSSA